MARVLLFNHQEGRDEMSMNEEYRVVNGRHWLTQKPVWRIRKELGYKGPLLGSVAQESHDFNFAEDAYQACLDLNAGKELKIEWELTR